MKLKIIPPLALLTTIFGCNIDDIPNTDNLYFPNYEGHIALVLGRDTVTIKKFLTDLSEDSSAIGEGPNLDLVITYSDSSIYRLGEKFVSVPAFSNSKFIQSPFGSAYTTAADTTFTIERAFNFNFKASKNEKVDSAWYESGSFDVELNSGFAGDVTYTFETSAFQNRDTEQAISINSVADFTGLTPVIDQNSIDLTGHKVILSNAQDSNIFVINISAAIAIPAGTFMSGNEYLNFSLDISNPQFEAIFGDFETDTFNVKKHEVSLQIFTEFSESGIEFETPYFVFDFENSFGITAGLDFSLGHATFQNRDSLMLTGTFTEELQVVEGVALQEVGTTLISSLTMNNSNSNLGALMAQAPDKLILPVIGISNPNGEHSNFMLNDSKIVITSTIFLPLSIKLTQFEHESEFELGQIEQLEQGEEIALLFNTVNELPFTGEIDLLFMQDSVSFDSLLSISIFQSPTSFDSNGKVTAPAENTAKVVLDHDKVQSLTEATSLKVITRLNSFGSQEGEFVQIFSDYTLITSLSLEGKVSVDFNKKK